MALITLQILAFLPFVWYYVKYTEGWFMKRSLMKQLLKWKTSSRRKPLILRGVRQCGKTWLLKEFGRLHYDKTAYFNFESQPRLKNTFAGSLDINRLITDLSALHREKLTKGKTLIIFDEIQECPEALNSLKYFCEQAPEYHIAAAGSLLGITTSGQKGFPVGKVNFLNLYPFSFNEFLNTLDGELAEYVGNISSLLPLSDAISERLGHYFRDYLALGGMPEVIASWKSTHDYNEIETVQEEILNSYELDFAKHAPKNDVPKLFLLWKSIPVQLARENGKFIYGKVKSGARARDLEDALRWLQEARLVYKINRIERPGIPPSAYTDAKFFKLYLFDTGLLRKMAKVQVASIITEPDIFGEFKGRLAENFVLQELCCSQDADLYYWTSGNLAEVDFIMQGQQDLLPIEVKSGTNVKSKSLQMYREKYKPPCALRFSMLNLRYEKGVLNIPLYLVHQLPVLLELAAENSN